MTSGVRMIAEQPNLHWVLVRLSSQSIRLTVVPTLPAPNVVANKIAEKRMPRAHALSFMGLSVSSLIKITCSGASMTLLVTFISGTLDARVLNLAS